MLYMNEGEIAQAAHRHRGHPVLGRAAALLRELRDAVNRCSDGWAYWLVPCRAARRLQELLQRRDPERVVEADFRKAATPIKAMLTKHAGAFGPDAVTTLRRLMP